ncbi:MAG: VWA domain-containing protein [Candidatus Hadarchaeum sp.]
MLMNNITSHTYQAAWRHRALYILNLFLVVSLIVPTIIAKAQVTPTAGNLSVFFIIDDSGSMSTSDPEDLRVTAVKLFVTLLDPGDGAAVIIFSDDSRIASDFTLIQGRQEKLGLIDSINTQSDGYTHMKAAFEDVLEVISHDTTGNQQIILFLTDGKPELEGGLPPGYEDETLDLVKRSGLPVLAIGLTSGGLTPFLGRIPGVAAEGSRVIPAKTAVDLLDVYLNILGQLKDRTVIGSGSVRAPGQADLTIEPMLAQYVDSVSFIAVYPETASAALIAPDGLPVNESDASLSESFVDVDPKFKVVTLSSPQGGAWQMEFRGTGVGQARAILRSRLRVRVLQPGYFAPLGQPMPLVANLIVEDPPNPPIVSIGDVIFSALIETPDGRRESLDLLYDDGTHGDQKAGDGAYSNIYVNTDVPGTYGIIFSGYKGAVPVSARVQVEVIEFPQIVLQSPSPGKLELRGTLPLQAKIVGGDPPQFDQGEIVAIVTAPDGSKTEPIQMTYEKDVYSASYTPTMNGIHTIEVNTMEATYRGIPMQSSDMVKVDVVLIPTISISAIGVEQGQVIQLGKLLNLKQGKTIEFTIRSTSEQKEVLQVSLSGVPGGKVQPNQITLPAKSEQKVVLTLSSESDIAPGSYQGALVFSTTGRAELQPQEWRFAYELARTLIRVEPSVINLRNIIKFGPDSIVKIRFTSSSPFPHPLAISSVQPDTFEVVPDLKTILPETTTEVSLRITSKEKLQPGDYTIQVAFHPPDPMVPITPEAITIQFHVPTLLELYGTWALLLLGSLLILASTVYVSIPKPFGQLITLTSPVATTPKVFYLSKYVTLRKGYNKSITIGSGKGNDIQLEHASVAKRHAEIRSGTRVVTREIGKGRTLRRIKTKRRFSIIYPEGGSIVTINNVRVPSTGRQMERNDKVQIGDYLFEYR